MEYCVYTRINYVYTRIKHMHRGDRSNNAANMRVSKESIRREYRHYITIERNMM